MHLTEYVERVCALAHRIALLEPASCADSFRLTLRLRVDLMTTTTLKTTLALNVMT